MSGWMRGWTIGGMIGWNKGWMSDWMRQLAMTFTCCLMGLTAVGCAGTEDRTPVAPETTVAEQAAAIHARALVLDAHADIEIPGEPSPYVGEDGRSQVALDKMRAGGVDAVVLAAAVGPGPRNAAGYAEARRVAEREIQAVVDMAAADRHAVVAVRSDDLIDAHRRGDVAFVLGLQNALILGQDPTVLDEFHARGVRVFALTHMGHNDFADSSRPLFIAEEGRHEPEAEHGGLSALGIEALERANQLGVILDISQLSRAAALEVMKRSRAPVIASHSNVRALTDVSRNLSDEEIDAIGASGGVIHVAPFRAYLFDSTDASLDRRIRAARVAAELREDYYYPFELYWEIADPQARAAFTGAISGILGDGSVDAMLNHLDYIVARIGIDHVGIGTDFNHGSRVAGFRDASEALNVTTGLLQRGYTEAEIEKIWGGNFLRVWREVEALAGAD